MSARNALGRPDSASGLLVVPTFRTPHVTIAHDELEELVRRLLGCGHVDLVNPYHEREED